MTQEDSAEDEPGGIASIAVNDSGIGSNNSHLCHIAGQVFLDVFDDIVSQDDYVYTNMLNMVSGGIISGSYDMIPKLIPGFYEQIVASPFDVAEDYTESNGELDEGEDPVVLNYQYLVDLFGINSEFVRLFELRYLVHDFLSMRLEQKREEILAYNPQG